MTDGAGEKVTAVVRAAERTGADYAELLYWLLNNVKVSPALWSAWQTGSKPIADRLLVDFNRDRQHSAVLPVSIQQVLDYVKTELQRALTNAPVDKHGEIIEHFRRQVTLLADLAASAPMAAPRPSDASTAQASGGKGARRRQS